MKFQTKVKKSISILLSVMMLISVFTAVPFTVGAVSTDVKQTSETSGDFEYEILDDGTAEITGYNGSATELAIPKILNDYYNSYYVTRIGWRTFRNCTSLINITIPDCVTSIGQEAFYSCSNLTNITIPDSVTGIGNGVFEYCTSLESITIGNGVTSTGTYTFKGCTNLKNVIIGNGVTSIGWSAFEDCTSLTSITIPDGVTHISYSAFEGCTNLTSITIPNSVTSIYSDVFKDTTWYNNQPEGVVYAGKVAYNYKGTCPETVEIKESTVGIAEMAFKDCTRLKSITIPDSVINIEAWVFRGCASLKTIVIPDSVTSIGSGAFADCESLISVKVGNGIKSIGTQVFRYCKSLTNIIIPDSVTSIGWSVFEYCTSLESITIPDSVISIDQRAFYDCGNLEDITIGNSVTSIEGSAFYGCNNLSDVYYTGSAEEWKKINIVSYNNTCLTNAIIHYNSTSPNKPTTPDTEQPIADFLYYDNEDGTCSIYDYVGTSENVVIPESIDGFVVTGIKGGTFYGIATEENEISDWDIISISIPKTVTDIEAGAFRGCTSLKEIIVDENNTEYKSVDGVLYTTDSTCLLAFPQNSLKIYSIPSLVRTISSYAFENSCIEIIYMGNALQSIDDYAFSACDFLTDVYYDGTPYEWDKLLVGSGNGNLLNALIHKNSNFKTISIDDTWYFNNLTYDIAPSVYLYLTGNYSKAEILRKWSDGTNGQCYGMVASAICTKFDNPMLSSYNGSFSKLYSSNLESSVIINDLNIEVAKLIATTYLWQADDSMQIERINNTNKYDDLIKNMQYYQRREGPPVSISLCGSLDGEKAGHQVLATSIITTEKGYDIYVYDCNYPGDNNRKISFYKDSEGKITEWSYNISSNILFSSADKNAELTFSTNMQNITKDIFVKGEKLSTNYDTLIESDEAEFKINGISSTDIDYSDLIRCTLVGISFDENGDPIIPRDQYLYWYQSDDKYTITSDKDGSFSIAENDGITFDYNSGDEASIVTKNNEKTLQYISKNPITDLKINVFDEDYDITVVCSSNGNIEINPNDGKPIITGVNEIIISEDGQEVEINGLEEGKSYTIDDDSGITLVDEDGNVVESKSSENGETTAPDQTEDNVDEKDKTTTPTESTTETGNAQNKLIGDVNLDGTVDVKDVTYIQKHLASLIFLNDYQLARADTNNDGRINIKDATTIQEFLAKLIKKLG